MEIVSICFFESRDKDHLHTHYPHIDSTTVVSLEIARLKWRENRLKMRGELRFGVWQKLFFFNHCCQVRDSTSYKECEFV